MSSAGGTWHVSGETRCRQDSIDGSRPASSCASSALPQASSTRGAEVSPAECGDAGCFQCWDFVDAANFSAVVSGPGLAYLDVTIESDDPVLTADSVGLVGEATGGRAQSRNE